MMDILITLFGGLLLGYLLGVRVTKWKVLTMLERMKREYLNGIPK